MGSRVVSSVPAIVEKVPPVTRLITLVTPVGFVAVQVAVSPWARLKVVKLWNRLPPAWVPPEMVVTVPDRLTRVPVAKALVSGVMAVATWAKAGAATRAAIATEPSSRPFLTASLPAR